MRFKDLFGPKVAKPAEAPKVEGRNVLTTEQVDAGRMMGPAKGKDPSIIDRWKELLKSHGISPTERILGIARWDLENFTNNNVMPQPEPARSPTNSPALQQQNAAQDISAGMAEVNLAMEMMKLLKQLVLDKAQDTVQFNSQIAAMRATGHK